MPAVFRSGRRETSGTIKELTACFDGLADPRVIRQCDHRLIDILVIAVSAVIACAESWEDIKLYGRSKQAWLKTFLDGSVALSGAAWGLSRDWGSCRDGCWRMRILGCVEALPKAGAERAVVDGVADLEQPV